MPDAFLLPRRANRVIYKLQASGGRILASEVVHKVLRLSLDESLKVLRELLHQGLEIRTQRYCALVLVTQE